MKNDTGFTSFGQFVPRGLNRGSMSVKADSLLFHLYENSRDKHEP